MQVREPKQISPVLAAAAGWVVPGLGYWLIGEKTRGVVCCVAILLTFLGGLLIGGVRVVDVPGYDLKGEAAYTPQRVWKLRAQPVAEVFNKPWYIAQALVGPVNLVATAGSLSAAKAGVHPSTARIFDIGTLYTAVAGMLNLLVMIDSAHRAGQRVTLAPEAA
jgi:hypothetical protein